MSRLYVETSALLRALLEGDASLRTRLTGAEVMTSALTFLELDESFGALTVVSCDDRIRRSAEALGLPVAP